MRPMTHGETRGTLILLALMATVVGSTYLVRCQQEADRATMETATSSAPQSDRSPRLADRVLTRRQLDSMRLDDDASRQTRRDSITRAARAAANPATQSPPASKPAIATTPPKSKPSRGATPSPLDRPL